MIKSHALNEIKDAENNNTLAKSDRKWRLSGSKNNDAIKNKNKFEY